MKYVFNFFIIFFIFSCNSNTEDTITIKTCKKIEDCNKNQECKFNSIKAENGICVTRIKCEYSYQCSNNRKCQKDYNLEENFCGNIKKFNIFTMKLNPAFLYREYYQKIELSYPQGEYHFELINGSLPNGIELNTMGVLSGIVDDEIKNYQFTVRAINSPKNSNIFFNYKYVEKTFILSIKDNNPCNYECNKFQYCDLNKKECIDTQIPENMTRIYTRNNEIYQGILISTYDHNKWWWDSNNEYTYALFIKNNFNNGSNDKSVMLFSSNQIEKIENGNSYSNISDYDNFLKENYLTFNLPLKEELFIIEGNEGYHKEESGYGDFAYDFVINDNLGNNHQNKGDKNKDYYIFNKSIYLPISGEVFEIHDNNPDNNPGNYIDKSEANMVGIKLKGNYYLYLLHLKQNSIPLQKNNNCDRYIDDIKCIKVGDKLSSGTYIGKVGNSGVSLLPHLHLTMFIYDINSIDVRMWSIPSLFKNIEVKKENNYKIYNFYRPKTSDYIKSINK